MELVDTLRCPAQHADTYLVAAPREMVGRYIMTGTLGCPICAAEYEIVDGVTSFSPDRIRAESPVAPVSDYEALRCSALLNLQGSGGFAVLAGDWGALGHLMTHDGSAHLVLANPPRTVLPDIGVSIISADARFPLASQMARGVALDADSVARFGIEQAAALVQNGGRLVAPHDCPLPANATLLVSDDRHWVAELSHLQETIVTLTRRS